jgi:hypothetical protein
MDMNKYLQLFLNYTGQLRIYSFVDLLVFATAFTRDLSVISGIALLWISFLVYLENRHHDPLRLPIYRYAWLFPYIFSITLLPELTWLTFSLFSYLYTKKVEGGIWSISAPFWRGLQTGALAFQFDVHLAVLAFVLIFIRNIIGDVRDASTDKQRGIITIPVVYGAHKNHPWAFYAHILFTITTTIIWFQFSFLDHRLILPTAILQLVLYPLTPRVSNPKYLQIYI